MSIRNYVNLVDWISTDNSWQIHYREAGAGRPIILLHPSPLSSEFMEPLIKLFATQGRAIAWDTPGYGQSDQLPIVAEDLSGDVRALHDFILGLGLEKPVIYGSATGAQIAIEFAKQFPDDVSALLLENVAWFNEQERDAIADQYFPDLSPQNDGSHLQKLWSMVDSLYRYFPWFEKSEEALVDSVGAPLELRHSTVLQYLIAGKDYARAYRAAFLNEKIEQYQSLTVPTHILIWENSIIKKYSERLFDASLPEVVQLHYVKSGIDARYAELKRRLQDLTA